jgi:hypothetical protein
MNSPDLMPTPEPSTLLMVLAALPMGLGYGLWRMRYACSA